MHMHSHSHRARVSHFHMSSSKGTSTQQSEGWVVTWMSAPTAISFQVAHTHGVVEPKAAEVNKLGSPWACIPVPPLC